MTSSFAAFGRKIRFQKQNIRRGQKKERFVAFKRQGDHTVGEALDKRETALGPAASSSSYPLHTRVAALALLSTLCTLLYSASWVWVEGFLPRWQEKGAAGVQLLGLITFLSNSTQLNIHDKRKANKRNLDIFGRRCMK